jgi:hypothetical protein
MSRELLGLTNSEEEMFTVHIVRGINECLYKQKAQNTLSGLSEINIYEIRFKDLTNVPDEAKIFFKSFLNRWEDEVNQTYGITVIGLLSKSIQEYRIQINTDMWTKIGSTFEKEFIQKAAASLKRKREVSCNQDEQESKSDYPSNFDIKYFTNKSRNNILVIKDYANSASTHIELLQTENLNMKKEIEHLNSELSELKRQKISAVISAGRQKGLREVTPLLGSPILSMNIEADFSPFNNELIPWTSTSTTSISLAASVGISVLKFYNTLVEAADKIKNSISLKYGLLKNKCEEYEKSNEYYRKLKNLLLLSMSPTALGRGIFNSAAKEFRDYLGISVHNHNFKAIMKRKEIMNDLSSSDTSLLTDTIF